MKVSEHAPDCHEMVTDRKIPCQDQGEKGQVNPSMSCPRNSGISWSPESHEAPAVCQHCWGLGALGLDATNTFSPDHWF